MSTGEVSPRLLSIFTQALLSTLNTVTGEQFELVSAPNSRDDRRLQIWRQEAMTSDGRTEGTLSLASNSDFTTAAGRMMLEFSGITDSSDEEIAAVWKEIAAQILGDMANRLNAAANCDLTLGPGAELPWSPESGWAQIGVRAGDSTWRLLFSASSSLEDLLATEVAPAAGPAPVAHSGTFDLLMDVALPVAVSFGRTALQIREVLKLNSGSIIELNRLVSEPVDVVVNDCIIARGEVVVVDGNYGVRITQVASREARLRSGMAAAENSTPAGVAA